MCRFCLALYLLYQLAGFAFWWSDGLFELNRLDCTQACLSLLSDAGWGKNCLSRSAKVKHLMDMDERFCPSVWDAFAGMFFFWEASDRVWGGWGWQVGRPTCKGGMVAHCHIEAPYPTLGRRSWSKCTTLQLGFPQPSMWRTWFATRRGSCHLEAFLSRTSR